MSKDCYAHGSAVIERGAYVSSGITLECSKPLKPD